MIRRSPGMKTLLRVGPVFILSALVTLHSASLSLGAGAAGDFVRCIIECASMFNQCRDACHDQCSQDPAFSMARRECRQACTTDCREIRRECFDECKLIKPPPTPTVP